MRKNQNIRAAVISENCRMDAAKFIKLLQCNEVKVAHQIEELTTPPFHCVVFDSSVEGIKAAKAAGLRTVGVGNREVEPLADEFVLDYSEIELDTFLESGRVKQMPICETAIIEEGFKQNDVSHLESLFALGNGYMGLRGTYDESDEGISELCGMYINGIFAKRKINHLHMFKAYPTHEQTTVNLSDWRIVNLYIDGERACFSNENIKGHKRVLDMEQGNICRTFVFETKSGKRAAIESMRIVNMDEVHGAEISYRVTPLNFSGEIVIEMQVVKRNKMGKVPAFVTKVTGEKIEENTYLLTQEVESTNQKVVTAIYHEVLAKDYRTDIQNEENLYRYTVTANVKQNDSIETRKYAVFCSSADNKENMDSWVENQMRQNVNLGFDELQKRQAKFWKQYWEKGDIRIKGNPADAQAVRYSLFQLRQQLATVNACSIGATGLTGPNYSGKVFWDTEMYLMPYYNFTYPQTQKELLMYRYRILDKARARAKEFDLDGAMYAWASINGEETSDVYEASTAEYHLQSDIPYAIWRYVDSTEDKEFLYQYGAEIVFETAKFMFSRGKFIEANDGKFCINVVCGPDEYGCGVNNNCYTNLMVQWHFNYALSVADNMKKHVPQQYKELADRINLKEEEFSLWKKAADNMYYKYNEALGIHEQDDSFVRNDPVDMTKIPMNTDIRFMFHPLDLWRMQVSKQADVVLLNFIRGDIFTQEEKLRDYEYYEPRCNHGSSLSTAIHQIMACELEKPEHYEFFRCSAYMDISDFKKNTKTGVHMACLGGVWMCVVNGYLGMRHYSDGVHFTPHIPSAWKSYNCKFAYRGAVIDITVTNRETIFELIDGKEMTFHVCGEKVHLTNKSKRFTCCTDCLA